MLGFLLGIICGAVTGILPSLHINTVAFLLANAHLEMSFISFSSFIVGLSVSHNFFDFVPAIIFGSGGGGRARPCQLSRATKCSCRAGEFTR